jgi:hypothetical protein
VQLRHIAAAVTAVAALAGASAADAAVQLGFSKPGTTSTIDFNGLYPGTDKVYQGLSGKFVLTLLSIDNEGYRWNFGYTLSNTSKIDSALSVIGWDIGPDFSSASGVKGVFDRSSSGNMSFAGPKEFCLKASNGANCSGGGGGGIDDGAFGTGVFSLNFASEIVGGANKKPVITPLDAPALVTLENFNVRYQSVPGISSTVGAASYSSEGPAMVPEPATWAMMIVGFFSLGAMIRRSRTILAA